MSLDTPTATVQTVETPHGPALALSGRPGLGDLPDVLAALRAVPCPTRADLSGAEAIDTAIAWALTRHGVEVTGATDHVAQILRTVAAAIPDAEGGGRPARPRFATLEALGRGVVSALGEIAALAGTLGLFLVRLAQSLARPGTFRLTALARHAEDAGLRAVPIVALMAFLIGIVLAFQGAAQLQQFGAEIYVVELIAISILRELGILLTSIIVAGRTASAYTAAIGSMKMREEIDAMRILGIDPAAALIVPRVLALILMLPILGLIADLAGLAGGMLMSWLELGISPALWITRLGEGVDISHVWIGLVKAPAFAVIIGVIGCRAGLAVGQDAESLGQQTSRAVVAAIFAVIVTDAAFSIFFAQLGL